MYALAALASRHAPAARPAPLGRQLRAQSLKLRPKSRIYTGGWRAQGGALPRAAGVGCAAPRGRGGAARCGAARARRRAGRGRRGHVGARALVLGAALLRAHPRGPRSGPGRRRRRCCDRRRRPAPKRRPRHARGPAPPRRQRCAPVGRAGARGAPHGPAAEPSRDRGRTGSRTAPRAANPSRAPRLFAAPPVPHRALRAPAGNARRLSAAGPAAARS